jgi:putative transposase/transposase-like zinc-binding protein
MCTIPRPTERPSVELADIFRMHGDRYVQNHVLTSEQYKVFHAIKNCRTSALGGHAEQCDQCHAIQYAYNSCRNRHCPKCESFKAAKWLEARQAELLPVRYFHVVFTLPHELNNLVLYNKRILYNLLFESTWETLKKLGADPKRLNGEMGMLSILHTWSQNLLQHNHVHCIVPGGALKANGEWKAAKKYLFPVKVLGKLFRGIFVSKLRNLYQSEKLKLPDRLTEKLSKNNLNKLLDVIMQKKWVVYAKPPFGNSEDILNYLGRYTHKIAISNYRILACNDQWVTFKWRDYSDDNKMKIMQLKPEEFIRRFLSHVVPNGFMRIRSFGFLANACKVYKVAEIQKQLKHKPKKAAKKKNVELLMLELTGKDITLCPICKQGKLRRIREIPPTLRKTIFDTS